jgi:uncharacterized protein (TIGR03118 family)
MSKFEVNQHNLNSSIPLVACNGNVSNVNPMGVATIKKDYYVANTGSTTVSHYNKKGIFLNNITTTAPPTALVATGCNLFANYSLIVVTNGGTIEGYNANVNVAATVAIVTAPVVVAGVYTGVAIHKNKLFAVNFAAGVVEVYDNTFTLLYTFTDADLVAAGYAPYNIALYGKHAYVTFAKPDLTSFADGIGSGFVDTFKQDGTHMKRLINNDPLNAPYGLLFSKCGKFLYVANNGDGKINVFAREDGCFIQPMHDCYGNIFQLGGLRGIHETCDGIAVVAAINDEASGLLAILKDCKECCSKSH